MAELPLVLTYATAELKRGDPAAWRVFRAEWAVSTAVALLQAYDERRVILLYPPRLREWIRSVGVANITSDDDGDTDEDIAGKFDALLHLLDELPHTSAFVDRLALRAMERRDRSGWVRVMVQVGREGRRALVDEDLDPFDLPYSPTVTESRLAVPNPWSAAVARRRHLTRFPGGGDVPPDTTYRAVQPPPQPRFTAPPPASSPPRGPATRGPAQTSRRIVSADALEHGDVPDHRFDIMYELPPRGVALGLANFLGVDVDELERYSTGHLVSGLCHLVAALSQGTLAWSRTVPENSPVDLEGLLRVVGRRSLRDAFRRFFPHILGGTEDRRRRWIEEWQILIRYVRRNSTPTFSAPPTG
ncbi:hypothetical protein MMPV_008457 [Pyropia vietnamensis]